MDTLFGALGVLVGGLITLWVVGGAVVFLCYLVSPLGSLVAHIRKHGLRRLW